MTGEDVAELYGVPVSDVARIVGGSRSCPPGQWESAGTVSIFGSKEIRMSDPSSPYLHLETLSSALAGMTANASAGIVSIHSQRFSSSGFAWRPDLILTADEALAEEGDISVALPNGERRSAQIVGRDPTTDIALLRVEGAALTPRELIAAPIQAGSLVVVVGAAEGAPLTALGTVALAGPAWRSMRGGEIDARVELDIRLRRQAEGGVALDAAGQVIGMAVFGPRRRVLVIPAVTIERVACQLERHGRVPRGYLGLSLHPVRLDGDATKGAMVISVDKEGPAAIAGVRQGDVIVTCDCEPLLSVNRLLRVLGPDSVGRRVTLGLLRAGDPLDLPLTIGERPTA
jgi:S1-C subfamily serine protease